MDNVKRKAVVVVGLVIIMLGGSFYGYIERTKAVISNDSHIEKNGIVQEDTVPKVTVYISGAVLKPGIYEVRAGTRVIEALEAAGGLLENADMNRTNMARKVKDGMHIRVWEKSDKRETVRNSGKGQNGEVKTSNAEKININSADINQLMQLTGVGLLTAQNIVEYRSKHGAFQNIDDLIKVPGIGPRTLQKIRNQLTI